MKENLYTYTELQHRRYATEIGSRAVAMFKQGYTLRTISKSLNGSYSGFSKDEIRNIIGKALTDFVRAENRGLI